MVEKRFRVTPWEVEGRVDYDELIRMWGTQRITDELLDEIEKRTGNLHMLLRRRVFYSHRDLDWILDIYDKERFVLYTGRGPSGPVHIGHLIPWILCKYLQDSFDTNLPELTPTFMTTDSVLCRLLPVLWLGGLFLSCLRGLFHQ